MDPDIKILLSALVGAAIGLGIVFVARAHAETIDGDRIHIVDGDTVALPCDPARGIYPGCAERVRLVGIDAPETGTRARCEAEAVAATGARRHRAARSEAWEDKGHEKGKRLRRHGKERENGEKKIQSGTKNKCAIIIKKTKKK